MSFVALFSGGNTCGGCSIPYVKGLRWRNNSTSTGLHGKSQRPEGSVPGRDHLHRPLLPARRRQAPLGPGGRPPWPRPAGWRRQSGVPGGHQEVQEVPEGHFGEERLASPAEVRKSKGNPLATTIVLLGN